MDLIEEIKPTLVGGLRELRLERSNKWICFVARILEEGESSGKFRISTTQLWMQPTHMKSNSTAISTTVQAQASRFKSENLKTASYPSPIYTLGPKV